MDAFQKNKKKIFMICQEILKNEKSLFTEFNVKTIQNIMQDKR